MPKSEVGGRPTTRPVKQAAARAKERVSLATRAMRNGADKETIDSKVFGTPSAKKDFKTIGRSRADEGARASHAKNERKWLTPSAPKRERIKK